jgi:hypothetical protein
MAGNDGASSAPPHSTTHPIARGVPVRGEEEDSRSAVGWLTGPIMEDTHAARGGGGLPTACHERRGRVSRTSHTRCACVPKNRIALGVCSNSNRHLHSKPSPVGKSALYACGNRVHLHLSGCAVYQGDRLLANQHAHDVVEFVSGLKMVGRTGDLPSACSFTHQGKSTSMLPGIIYLNAFQHRVKHFCAATFCTISHQYGTPIYGNPARPAPSITH